MNSEESHVRIKEINAGWIVICDEWFWDGTVFTLELDEVLIYSERSLAAHDACLLRIGQHPSGAQRPEDLWGGPPSGPVGW
jgi:hypothetical protein